MKHVIMINGKKRSGKNFVAELWNGYFTEVCGLKVKEVSFAYHLKNDVCIMLGITMEELEYHKEIGTEFQVGDKKFSIRTILQNYGTEVRRREDDDIWIKRAMPDITDNDADIILITDWRFENELVKVKDILFEDYSEEFIVHDLNIQNSNVVNEDAHASENDLNDFKFTYMIRNDEIFDNKISAYTHFYDFFEEFYEDNL